MNEIQINKIHSLENIINLDYGQFRLTIIIRYLQSQNKCIIYKLNTRVKTIDMLTNMLKCL